ncbi:hypothetical protein J7E96_19705 [Streptomyces sp. ISL-96]|uniref:hypothetical protein n=1 Tax=Streptomyces sp. ISL-96 TaxID=2819191 RepID=UPI001BEB929E|nr:hypothetical protein [Streptomyces sp. ISL-96]MBT2490700.1 hypothetical protein [Streptomyces sp. ISL-96]
MVTTIRTAISAARDRRTARRLADVRFCDGCAEVCDGACRSAARRRRVQTPTLASGPR